MELPNVVHPTVFTINGHKVQVVAYCVMTESQARAAAIHSARSGMLKKKPDPKKVLQLLTLWDRDTVGQLGP
ncbi:MAG: hypothetical protein KF788_08735 [Piscinibacter sp.]|nr:hypothetical protein [Piscinibacter sp.]